MAMSYVRLQAMLQDLGVNPDAVQALAASMTIVKDIPLVTTPDATDEATAIALANANKAKINQLLVALGAS